MVLQYPTWLYRLTISNPTLDSCALYTWHLQQPTVRPKARFRSSTGASMCMAALQPVACFFFSACIATQNHKGNPQKHGFTGKTNPWWCGCLSWPINLAMSYPSEYQLAKKSFQLGLALLQEPSNTIIYCKTFWPLTTPQSSHSSFLFRINHNNSSTWEVWPFGDDSPYVATWGCDQIYPDLIVTARVISCNMLQSFMCW